jgi:hypothetical protein
MENEVKLVVKRLGENDGYSRLPDKGPWVVRKPGAHPEEPSIRRIDGSLIGSEPQEDDLPSAHRSIFGDLIEDIREYVRTKKTTVHLYNEWGQLLRSISPERNIGLYESELTVRNAFDGKEVNLGSIPHDNDRPLCPRCNEMAGLEPAHYFSKKSPWRWVCVDCDYAVSCDNENEFSPTGRLESREMRRTRHKFREVYSMLWNLGLMERGYAYKLLKQLFPHKEGQRVNFATLNAQEMQRAADYAEEIMRKRGREDQAIWARNEMRQLYSDISHEDGKPTYLGDDVYLFPDGRVGGL